MRLASKLAVVTGAAHGIGRAIALRFAAEGASVAVVDVDGCAALQTATAIRQCGGAAFAITADLADAEQITAAFAEVERRAAALHILINNAGITPKHSPVETTMEEWDHCFDVNLRSAWLCSKAAVPLMRRGGGGSIVSVTSTHAHRTAPGFFPYAVSKSGLEALTRCLAVEYGPEGIRANSIAPGMIRSRCTDQVMAQYRDPAEAWKRILESHPLRRIGAPEDIASAALFLASEEAAYVTGVTLFVDGGRNAQLLSLDSLREE